MCTSVHAKSTCFMTQSTRAAVRLLFFPRNVPLPPTRWFSSARQPTTNLSEEDVQSARKWMAQFNPDTIPREIGELSFSRSSGPGGQNVNKVNSKATLRIDLNKLLLVVPRALHPQLRASRYYAAKSNSLIIQADDSRKQRDNEHSCYARLHDLILDAASTAIPGETSAAQSERVKKLKKSENEARLRLKKTLSNKKQSRIGGGNPDY